MPNSVRRQQFSAQIQSPKDFTLRQGGKRSDGRSIQKYVTDFTSAGNAADAICGLSVSTRCAATARRVAGRTPAINCQA
ncbi:hypothetical protein CDC58_00795 [Salmonella enterica]|nr:hypothetical protein CDC58_00795 [Salmonella enterica]